METFNRSSGRQNARSPSDTYPDQWSNLILCNLVGWSYFIIQAQNVNHLSHRSHIHIIVIKWPANTLQILFKVCLLFTGSVAYIGETESRNELLECTWNATWPVECEISLVYFLPVFQKYTFSSKCRFTVRHFKLNVWIKYRYWTDVWGVWGGWGQQIHTLSTGSVLHVIFNIPYWWMTTSQALFFTENSWDHVRCRSP